MQSLRYVSHPFARAFASRYRTSVIHVCAGLAMAASLSGAALVTAGTAAAESPQTCSSLASGVPGSGTGIPVCVSQQGTTVIIVVGAAGGSGSPTGTITTGQQVRTYAQRQAIRDQFRGQIDELTLNDELGDGVSLYQALSDGMAAQAASKPVNTP